ncbi:uncharacterized protein EV422DRAFT_525772 [Fimicolochytrium jonesii]|uniref:uncharacterized protein n=1 Tax=Fimicolochytrium jonesii TaxID=1396493 RepID=UPI0022FE37F7|nr:uncharacterized protein EV422DRAFT_525772 [Fimicolochytrium jonesii]KAI8822134.1 hypothetical protein EV422DRAFT_525772 [Fimicolochytrium jonesii]
MGLPVILYLLVSATIAAAYPTGAGICYANESAIAAVGSMGPSNDNLGYALVVGGQATSYSPGRALNVTLTGNQNFMGLLLYAASAIDATAHAGTWSGLDADKFMFLNNDQGPVDCSTYGINATVTHDSPMSKSVPLTFTWTPSSTTIGDVHFYSVVVVSDTVGFQVLQSAKALTAAA